MKKVALGVDIGGTKTAFGFVDEHGKLLIEKEVPTRNFAEAADLATELHHFYKETGAAYELIGIGIGAPNGNQHTGTIDFAPNLHWKGQIQLQQIFENQFKLPVIVTNDANAAAIGEKMFGAARDLTDFVEITLGTGVGSGVFVQNELVLGKHSLAGEYGHIRVIPDGRVCGCGRKGCLETYASSTGMVRSIVEYKSDNKHLSPLSWHENPTAKDVFEYAAQGDLFANELISYTAKILGSALADFAAFSDPQAFILFGGLSKSGTQFTQLVQQAMDENLLNIYKGKVEVRLSELNDQNAAVLGASAVIFWNTLKLDIHENS